MEASTNQQQAFVFPDPPAYYKLFENAPRALKKPNLDLLYHKHYTLRFIDVPVPIDPIDTMPPIESYGVAAYADFESSASKVALAGLMHEIGLKFEEYVDHITDEEGLSGVFNNGQQPAQQLQESEQKIQVIREMLMNAAYFINRIRRKQGLIMMKRELERAIEERDNDSKEMVKQIREAAQEIGIDQQ